MDLPLARLWVYPTDQGYVELSGNGSDKVFKIPHSLREVPSGVSLTPVSLDASSGYFVELTADFIVVTFKTAPVSGNENVKFYWEVSR